MLDVIKMDIRAKNFEIGTEKEFVLPFSQLNVIAGMNGSGKSFIMKFAWFSSYALQLYKVALLLAPSTADESFKKELQSLFRYTFDQSEEITGTIMIHDKDEELFRFIVSFDKGVLGYFNIDILNPSEFNIKQIQSVNYNSKEARTFNQIHMYHKLKTKFGIKVLDEKALEEFSPFFKIYDIIWYEQVLQRVQSFDKGENSDRFLCAAGKEVITSLFDDLEITDIKASLEFPWVPVFHMNDGTIRDALTLSAGSQSLLMLTMFT